MLTRRRSLRTAAGWLLLATALLAAATGWLLETSLGPSIDRWAVHRMTLMATGVVAEAAEQMSAATGTAPLVAYRQGSQGEIVGIEYNWLIINGLLARTAQVLEQRLRELTITDATVPLGEITGLRLFGGRGPMLPVRFVSVGAFTVEPYSEFVEAGVNQTLHRIGVDLSVRVAVVAPFVRDEVAVRARVPVLEMQVVGRVPQFLLQASQELLRRGPGGQPP
ncbi:sporulation protein YunB [Geochorda subterranea]|uniref:Sporulation protein YunB n=1 Tax=Geochorda subterranea TaxID=3109564 RepID=A0ABZ1BS90_9FIRM|nr:sporulation protein YunB [Limnochorda sp. LNt]WRP15685.1 sporulation protein YunB [Limnochorda sp. LNt]